MESIDTTFPICATCGVEYAHRPEVCAICADDRQWVPADGQRWTTLDELAAAGTTTRVFELEPGLLAIDSVPDVGIGQRSKVVRTDAGLLIWDPIGFVDAAAVDRLREAGEVMAIAASHPHMFGVQVAWSHALGGVPVLVAAPDAGWVARPDAVIDTWTGEREVMPGVTLHQVGGHFPGSAVVHWAAGADGRGVALSSDTVYANADRTSVSFMRSFPNRIPLSAAVADRVATAICDMPFDRLYGNFDNVIPHDAQEVVRRSAVRHAAWVSGAYDGLT